MACDAFSPNLLTTDSVNQVS